VPTAPLKPLPRGQEAVDRLKVLEKILGILAQAIAQRRRLGGLDVRIGHDHRLRLCLDPLHQGGQQGHQALAHQSQRLAQAQGIGVVLDIHARRAKMDDGTTRWALLGIRLDLGHQVVAQRILDLLGTLPIDGILVRAQLCQLGLGDQARLGLHGGQGHPDAPPQSPLVDLGPKRAHLLAAIAPAKGR